jgi:type 2 lantibiotic biosynthesis protein LanM
MSAVDASWRGATLAERLAHLRGRDAAAIAGPFEPAQIERARIEPTPTRATDDEPLAAWARACALGDMAALQRRLSWDGIDLAVARAAMAAEAPADFPVAAWVDRVSTLAAEARACAAAFDAAGFDTADAASELANVAELPFVEIWLPVLRQARRRLADAVPAARTWLADGAMHALEAQLLRELARLGELALFEDFTAHAELAQTDSPDGYRAWVHRLLTVRYAEVLGDLAVLTRQVVAIADQWVEQTGTLVRRLEEDQATIAATFGAGAGPVRRMTPGLSDRHDGGGRVALVELASGLRLAYKPRDVRLERAFGDWMVWLRAAGLATAPRAPRVIDRGTYGWVEWVEQEPLASPDAVHAWFRAAGALTCLAHVLGATDLHSENLIATAAGPVLVDTEMLLQPSTRPGSDAAPDGDSDGASLHSCLTSGIVSHMVIDRSGVAFDVGGLRPAVARDLATPMRRWLDLGRDEIRFEPQTRVHPSLHNDVWLHGERQRPEDFADDVCAGFAETWRFLAARREALLAADGPLHALGQCRTRVLFRPSDQYSTALYLLASPRYQRRGLDRSLALETFDRVFVREVERPRLWPLVGDERQALDALDIPRQTLPASAIDLEATSGELVRGYYARSGVEAMRSRLLALSERELASQIDQLRTALSRDEAPTAAAPDAAAVVGPRRDTGESDLVAAAERIGAALVSRAGPGSEGSLRWPSSGERADLYSGTSGIGLFLAALAAVTSDARWRDAAHRAFRHVDAAGVGADDPSPRIGACNGRPSVAYALATAGRLLEDESLVARAADLLAAMPPETIDHDRVLDIEGGAAGTLAACLAIYEACRDDRLLAPAGRAASRLGRTQIRSGAARGAWPAGDDGHARPGFAHGAAGIACALSRWAPHAADAADLTGVVREAWGFERRIFAESGGAWPTERRDGGRLVMAAWCHGAPGIALARALAPPALTDGLVAGEIEAAMKQTLSAPSSQLDHLCCGNLGRADVALTVGLRAGVRPWVDAGVTMARAVAARVLAQGRLGMRGRGFHFGAPAPEFFQGLAGVGYQLLRASSPSLVPSVLAFDTPAVGEPRPGARRVVAREEHR